MLELLVIGRKKKNKYGLILPPKKFDIEYEFYRGWSGKIIERYKISLDNRNKSRVVYFKVLLLRKVGDKWCDILVFDSFHKGKSVVHGHRVFGKKREYLKAPYFGDLNEGLDWVRDFLKKNHHSCVTLFINRLRKEGKNEFFKKTKQIE